MDPARDRWSLTEDGVPTDALASVLASNNLPDVPWMKTCAMELVAEMLLVQLQTEQNCSFGVAVM